jgi:predicted nucleotidyltransferase
MRSGIRPQRELIRGRLLELARADPRVVAAATTGSMATGTDDEWSDVDLAFAVEGALPLDDWTELVDREWGVVHWWDLPFRTAVYRVFLLREPRFEVNLAFFPRADFAAHGPAFRVEFGEAGARVDAQRPDERFLAGLAWHHVLHARTALRRGQLWRAEYMLHELRDVLVERESGRAQYRGAEDLPQAFRARLQQALPRALEHDELLRALRAAAGLCDEFVRRLAD